MCIWTLERGLRVDKARLGVGEVVTSEVHSGIRGVDELFSLLAIWVIIGERSSHVNQTFAEVTFAVISSTWF